MKHIVKPTLIEYVLLIVVILNYTLKNGLLLFFTRILFNNNSSALKNPNNILVLRTGSLGDSICALPAISAIRENYPNAKIDILSSSGKAGYVTMADILDDNIVNHIINYLNKSKKEIWQMLKKNKYDLVIQLPQDKTAFFFELKRMLFFKSLGIKSSFGWEIGTIKFLLAIQEKFNTHNNEVDRLLNILRKNNIHVHKTNFPLKRNKTEENAIKEFLKKNNIQDRNKNICLVPGANISQNKWPITSFNAVAKSLQKKGYNILIIGGRNDQMLAEQIYGESVFSFCGISSVLGSAEVLRNCCYTISNDTGPMHLSYAVGTPVIGIFSAWQLSNCWFPPMNGQNEVHINFNVPCKLCYSNKCKNNICMQGIKPSTIINSVEIKLANLDN